MNRFSVSYLSWIFIIVLFQHQCAYGQGFGKPLTTQGIENFTSPSAASRGAGGIIVGIRNDASVLFSNPSVLNTIEHIQFSVGGLQQSIDAQQVQQYAPLKYYSNFSLFMEGLTRTIPNPKYDTTRKDYTAADTVQRPFDAITPDWKKSQSRSVPLHAYLAVPLKLGDMKLSVGAGIVEYADLSWYFQNNNVLFPSLLSPNPFVPSRPPNDADSNSIPIQWYQSSQQRDGAIQGYGGAIALTVFEKLHVGVSGMILSGSSDDTELRLERGRIRLYQNYFRAESVYYKVSQTGRSEFSGQEFTVSSSYIGKYITVGVALTLPTTISRTFHYAVKTDTSGSSLNRTVSGKDNITVPLRSTLALSVALRDNLTFGFEYDIRSFASAEYTSPAGKKITPWVSTNTAHIGLQYQPVDWLTLRTGVREHAEVFEPEGNPIVGEPVNFTVYSCGLGLSYANARFNIAYEYSKMKFIDMWSGAVSINTKSTHTVVADIAYNIPWQ